MEKRNTEQDLPARFAQRIYLPIEHFYLIFSFAIETDFVWMCRSAKIWDEVKGFASASRALRDVAFSVWFGKVTILSAEDWIRFSDSRAERVLKFVRWVLYTETAPLGVSLKFPRATHLSICLPKPRIRQGIPQESQLASVLQHATTLISELVLSTIPLSTEVFQAISQFSLLRSLSVLDQPSERSMSPNFTGTFLGTFLAKQLKCCKYLHTLQLGVMLVPGGYGRHRAHSNSVKRNVRELPYDNSCRPDACRRCRVALQQITNRVERDAASTLGEKLPSLRIVKWRTWTDALVETHSVWAPATDGTAHQWQKLPDELVLSPIQRFGAAGSV